MEINDLLYQVGEWIKGEGPYSDVVISSRARLARNLAGYPFSTRADKTKRKEIEDIIKTKIEKEVKTQKALFYFSLDTMEQIDKDFLVERHLISKEHATSKEEHRGVAISYDETISIMVNEEDHLRLQSLRSGFQPVECWAELSATDDVFEKVIDYAFHPQFGYLTCCPTNVGTGLRISALCHLPAISSAKQVDKITNSLMRIGYNVRGLFGEGSRAIGDLFQISNQKTIGRTEESIVDEMKSIVIPQIIEFEMEWRERLLSSKHTEIEDRVWRSYGVLRHARSISSEEAIELLSGVRLGVYLGIIKGLSLKTLNQIFIFCQPSHIQKLSRGTLTPAERDKLRAEYIRQQIKISEP